MTGTGLSGIIIYHYWTTPNPLKQNKGKSLKDKNLLSKESTAWAYIHRLTPNIC